MRRFRFTLQPVRDLRDHRELTARIAMADRLRAHAAAHEAAEASLDRHRRAERALADAGGPAARLAQADRDRDGARLGLERAIMDLRDRTHGVDQARAALVEARRSVETLNRLEERQRDAHRQAMLAEEERDLADITEMRSARRIAAELRARRTS